MRVLKWIAWIVGGLLALFILGVLVLVWLVDPNGFKPRIEAAVRDATGREFALVGDIELGFFPWLALRTGEGRFGNAPGFGPDPMLSWKHAQLGAKLLPLLRGELIADRVRLDGVTLRLVRHADGHGNWEGIGSGKPADPQAKSLEFAIDGIEITDSHLLFVDEAVPRRVEIAAFQLQTDEVAPGKPFEDTVIAGVAHLEGFAPQGLAFRLAVPKAELPRDFSRIDVPKYSLALGGFEAEGAVGGTLGERPKLTGRLASNTFDPRALLTAVGIAPPKTTDPQALGQLRLEAGWTYDAGAIGVAPLKVTVDDTHLSGNFTRTAGEGTVGEFSLRGDALDITRYVPPSDPASPPFVLPVAMIRDLRYRGTLELERATYDDIVMNGVTLRLLLDEHGLRSVSAPAAAP